MTAVPTLDGREHGRMEELTTDNMEVESSAVEDKPDRKPVFTGDEQTGLARDDVDTGRALSGKVTGEMRRLIHSEPLNQQASLLREKLISRLSRYAGLPEECIEIFCRTDETIESIAGVLCKPGDEFLICAPEAIQLQQIAENHGIQVRYHHSFSPFSADPEGIVRKLSEKTKLVYLGNPNRLTGTVYSEHEIVHIVEHLNKAFLILEESYFEYYGSSLAQLVTQYDNLIIIRSFSDALGPNAPPFSYMLSGQKTLGAVRKISHGMKSSALIYAAALVNLRNIDSANSYVQEVRESMTYLSVKLRSIGVSCRPAPTDFLLIKVADPEKVVSHLKQDGIDAHDISDMPQLENYISVVVRDETLSLRTVEAFERMPGQYYTIRPIAPTRITLRRGSEEEMKDGDKEKNEAKETAGRI